MIDRKTFGRLLAKRLYPLLRADGFRGSGATLRRVELPVIHVINVQGSTSADSCFVNLGVHLDYLPMAGGGKASPMALLEYACAFRDRLDPPPDQRDRRWMYGDDEAAAQRAIAAMAEAYGQQGRAFFERYRTYPSAFDSLVSEALLNPPHPGHCLTLARVAQQLGRAEDARLLAREAIGRSAPAATGLRAQLQRVIDGR